MHDASPHALGHVVPMWILLGIFATLLVLTVITVTVASPQFDFGSVNLAIALGIATVKAALVALYFMHLRYDHPFNGLVFLAGLLFLGIFLAITLTDVIGYQPDINAALPK
jgi:cytochrome c oxidase subunit 4